MLIASAIMSLIFGITAGKCAAKASTGFAKNLRKDIYYNIQNFSFTNIDKFSTSSLITRLTTDVTNVQMAFQMIIRVAVRAPLLLMFSLFMTIRINSKISLIFLFIIPFLAIGLYLIIRKAHPLFEKVFKTYDKLNETVQENVRGIRVVKSYVLEEHENKKFKNISDVIYKDFSKAERLVTLNNPLMQFAVYSAILLISWFGAKLIVSDIMTTGELMSLFTYVSQILTSLMMLSMIFVMMLISRASAERIVEVLKENSDLTNIPKPVTELKNGDIDFEHVSFSYINDKKKLCLKNVDLRIKSGETVGIIGGTGSAKSTLVQLIPRLYDTTEGVVKVGNVDVKEYDLEVLRENVAMVLQKNELFSGTIKDNLRWGNENASDEELVHACQLAQADSFINEFPDKYDTYIDQGGTNVSGGQKQRLCIARALLKKPKILILDDSTSAVDTKTDKMIQNAFNNEIPETTKIIIAQRTASVENADKIIVLDNGKVTSIGKHEELLQTNEIYKEVYNSQNRN